MRPLHGLNLIRIFCNRSSIDMSHLESEKPRQSVRLGIGIDYGTSNSAASIFDGNKIHLVKLESDTEIMPSATYIDKDYQIITGQEAIEYYIESNMGRTVELSAEILGEHRGTTGQIGDQGLPEKANTEKVYGQSFIDGGQKGRLFRGIKRLLGSSPGTRLIVFERSFRLVALITPLLVRIKKAILEFTQESCDNRNSLVHACIGHPVNFEGKRKNKNKTALALLSEAYKYAEFTQQTYYPEPIAAAISYLHDHPQAAEEMLLAVDFGGGTLDLCILKKNGLDFSVVATHGIGLGGDHIDQVMFRELIFPLLGKGERWRRSGEDREIETNFPFEEYEDLLLNWTVSYILNQNKFTTPLMQCIEYDNFASVKFRRLYDLIKNNYSYLVFEYLKNLKAVLSSQESARLDIPELDIEIIVTRDEFESYIVELLSKFSKAILDLLSKADLNPQEIELVIRTGGSSLIPAFKNILEDLFPEKVIEHDPFTSVASGLAIADFNNLGRPLMQ